MSEKGNRVDPVTLTVIWNSLISIADEMGGALRRTAFSEAVREGEDFSAGVFDAQARLIAQGNFTPGHLGAMPHVVRNLLDYIPPSLLNEGDTIATNDSFLGGGHYPDFYLVTPVFDDGRLIGYVATSAHHVDVGGIAPGSQAVQGVSEAYQEGIRVLPVKLIRNGEFDEQLMRVILGNVRIPEKVQGDLRAQRNANHVGAERLRSLYRSYGVDVVERANEEIIVKSEERTRELIAKLPEGTYSFDDVMDDYGPGTEPIKVGVDVIIKGGEATIDFSRSSDQVNAGINSYINYTRAYAMFAMKVFAKVDVPHNHGVNQPIKIVARQGSFFNPQYPAPGAGRATVQIRIFDAVNGALARLQPDRAMGAFSHWANPNFSGRDDAGKRWVMYDLVFGGFGGQQRQDGPEGLCPVFNCGNVPVEVHETNNPVIVHRLEFIPDSGGAGRHRGGCGVRKDIEIRSDDALVTLLGDRHENAPFGVFGGEAGATGRTLLLSGGQTIPLGSKEIRRLKRGDIVRFEVAGAGGYGDLQERDKSQVRDDVRNGYVTREAAMARYGLTADDLRDVG